MVEYPAKIISAAALSILCIGAALAAPASPPLFSPNPNVGWISLGGDYLPPKSGAGPVGQDPRFPRVSNEEFRRTGRQPTIAMADLNAPILQPWTREALRKQRALVQSGKGGTSPQANCWPTGPAFVLHVIHPIFLVQGPKEVLMVWQGDHQVRHVYLTDKHSQNIKPSWFGESIGHYEGDALVVDTIGFNTKTYIDGFYTPHTERLHMIERFRMIEGGKVMEVGVRNNTPDRPDATFRISDTRNPILQPWVAERMQRDNAEVLAGKFAFTARSSCFPAGVPGFLVFGCGARTVYFIQTAKEIVMLNEGDQQVRHIYLNVPQARRYPTRSFAGAFQRLGRS